MNILELKVFNKQIKLFVTALLLYAVYSSIFSAALVSAETQARIINGQPSSVAQWPWVVSLGYSDLSPDKGHFCGGALIGPRHILTAGHCAEEFAGDPTSLTVAIGKTRLTSTEGRVVAVDGVVLHPSYVPGDIENDLAIIRLKEDQPGPYLPVVGASDAAAWSPGSKGTILGWGVIDPDFDVRPDNIQEAKVPIIADSDCENKLGLTFRSSSMFCAGQLASSPTADDGVDACYGDSGGPLVVETSEGYKLAGLVSWGLACGGDKYWGVYTRLAAFADWINSLPGITPYAISPAYITGRPEMGAKLTCKNAEWGGDPATRYVYDWYDTDEGLIKSGESPIYKIKRQDIGRSIYCSVQAESLNGTGYSDSEATGAIFPITNKIGVPKKAKKAVKTLGTSCKGKNCSVLLTLNNKDVKQVTAIFVPRGKAESSCTSGDCFMVRVVKNTPKAVTADTWLFSSKKIQNKEYEVYFRIIYATNVTATSVNMGIRVK